MDEDTTTQTTPTAAEEAEDKEWAQAEDNFAKENDFKKEDPEKSETGKDGKPTGKDDKGAQTPEEKKKAEEEEAEKAKNETPEETEARHKKEAEEKDKNPEGEEDQPVQPEVPDTRTILREMAADRKAIKEDIREQLFSDIPTQIEDEDGDVIKNIADLSGKRINPNTLPGGKAYDPKYPKGRAFNDEEAAAFILEANNFIKEKREEAEEKLEQITETTVTLKEETENIKKKYGELLQVNPNGIREKVWTAYEKTLVVDEKTNIITEAPVSLEEFYEIALAPYAKMAERLEAEAAKDEQQKSKDEEKDEELKRAKDNSDRADLTPGSASAGTDKEDEEWGKAAKAVFG